MDYSTSAIMKNLSISILLLIFIISIQSSQANTYSPTIFTLDVLENDDFGEIEQWSWDCNYSKNQIYLEFQDVPVAVQDLEEDLPEGFFSPGFGFDKCKISFDINKFVPTSVGFQGFLKRGAQVEVNVVYGDDLENFRISGSDLLDDNGIWTGDLKYYEKISENFHIEFILHTSTSLNQNDVVESAETDYDHDIMMKLEYDHSIAVVDKIWIIGYPSASDDTDTDDENVILSEAQSVEENDFEKLTDDQQEDEIEETTEVPNTEKPLEIIGEISTLQDILDNEDWDTNCDFKNSIGDICTPVVSPPDGKTGFFAPCNDSMQFKCIIVYSNDQKEIFSFKPNVFIDGDGTVEISTTGKKNTMGFKNERIGVIGSWDSSEKILNDDDQSKITFTLTGSGSGDVAIVESIVIMGWEKDLEVEEPDDDDKTLMIVLISVGGVILLVGLGAALYFLKKRSDRQSKVRNNYDSDNDAVENYPNTSTQYNYNAPRQSQSQGQVNPGFSRSTTMMEEDNDNSARRYFSSTPKQLLTRESSAGLVGGGNNPSSYGGVPLPGLTSTEDQGFSRSGNRNMSFSNTNYQQEPRSSTRMSYSNPNDPTGANRFKKMY